MTGYTIHKFAKSRIATIDVSEIGRRRHHVAALIEIDVTLGREKLKLYKKNFGKISFNAWLIKVISNTIDDYKSVAAFLKGKQKKMVFNDVNVSFLVEKELNGEKIPIPVLIEGANKLDIETITKQISDSKHEILAKNQLVLQKKASWLEKLYYFLPAFLRLFIWKFILRQPKTAFLKMGNVAITSLGMYGKISGWFIPISVHPICFGIGSIIKRPVVLNDKVEVRETVNMTILIDHDVIDGATIARFLMTLTKNIERGVLL